MDMILTSVDLSLADKHECPGIIEEGQLYIAKWHGELYLGYFEHQWYGLNFCCDFGASGSFQFDAPGYNSSFWEALWRLDEVDDASESALGDLYTALDEAGLPREAGVAGLVEHHRNNAGLAAALDMSAKLVTSEATEGSPATNGKDRP